MPTQPRVPWLTPGTAFPVTTTVRDGLYDRIPLGAPETALMATRAFLRMDRVQQLGFVSRVWPGAKHTRYEHSLGVLHVTREAVSHLRSRESGTWITDEDARTVCAAALLHDIGHYPFSHAIEELGPPILPHETVGRRLIADPDGEIAPVLREAWQVDPDRVAAMIDPKGRELPPADQTLRGLLSGPLDMDKLDYLPRDARACSVPYGGVDTARLIDALEIYGGDKADALRHVRGTALRAVGDKADALRGRDDGGENLVPSPSPPQGASAVPLKASALSPSAHIVVGSKGVSPLHSLINARQEMFDNVYWHHTNRACMAMLLRATQEAVLAGAVTPDELTGHDDASLLALFSGAEMPAETRRLTDALKDRRIHKRAVEFSARAVELYGRLGNLYFDPSARREVEIRLATRLGEYVGAPVTPEAVLIDIPKPEKWRTEVWITFERPPVGFGELMPWREVVGLGDEDFKRYEEHRRLIRIVTPEPYRAIVRDRWEDLVLPLLGGVF